MKITKNVLENIINDASNYINSLPIESIVEIIKYAKDKYYNDTPAFSDEIYDICLLYTSDAADE